MFVVVFSEEDKVRLIKNRYKFIHEDIVDGKCRFVFENKGTLNFANENIKVFTTNKLYF